jgi:hypothetical protein
MYLPIKILDLVEVRSKRGHSLLEQFANWKWDDIYRWHTKPTVKAAMDFQDKTKSGYNLRYELS